jgi:hypothetical protein
MANQVPPEFPVKQGNNKEISAFWVVLAELSVQAHDFRAFPPNSVWIKTGKSIRRINEIN